NVISVHVPALAERKSDIPLLVRYFLDRAAEELGTENKVVRPETMDYMCTLPWPGNVRQLENTCRWLTVMASGREIHMEDLPPELGADTQREAPVANNWEQALERWVDEMLSHPANHAVLDVAVPKFERIVIRTALKHTGGRKRDAAELLGWGRNTLTRKLAELGMPEL
ncbi:MAG: helix-turn-helix domain-containing protein, partial [Gammaproteobacteria bacterium]